jgi:hypothetical protein
VVFGRPLVILQNEISSESKLGEEEIRTRSSNNSVSPLKWLLNPLRPNVSDFPNATRGLSLVDNADSRNVKRGYAIGIPTLTLVSLELKATRAGASPSCTMRCSTPDDNVSIRLKTLAYCSSLHTRPSFRSALVVIVSKIRSE